MSYVNRCKLLSGKDIGICKQNTLWITCWQHRHLYQISTTSLISLSVFIKRRCISFFFWIVISFQTIACQHRLFYSGTDEIILQLQCRRIYKINTEYWHDTSMEMFWRTTPHRWKNSRCRLWFGTGFLAFHQKRIQCLGIWLFICNGRQGFRPYQDKSENSFFSEDGLHWGIWRHMGLCLIAPCTKKRNEWCASESAQSTSSKRGHVLFIQEPGCGLLWRRAELHMLHRWWLTLSSVRIRLVSDYRYIHIIWLAQWMLDKCYRNLDSRDS